MKIGVSMWSYFRPWSQGRIDIPGFIHQAKRDGAEGVELLDFFYNEPGGDYSALQTEESSRAKREQAIEALKETGLPIPIFSVAQNFAKTDPAEREKQLEKIKFGVDEAGRYGAEIVRVFAGDIAEGITFEDARAWIIEGLTRASLYAHEHGKKLALENHGHLAGRSDQVLAIISEVRDRARNDALGANPDTGNFMLVDQPSHEAIRDVATVAYMVHFKDFLRSDDPGVPFHSLKGTAYSGAAVGEGDVNLALCIQELKDAGFDGWLSVEYEGEEDSFTAVSRCIANAKKHLPG